MPGGPANATRRLVRAFATSGIDTTVVVPVSPDVTARTFREDGFDVVLVPHVQRYLGPRRWAPWRRAALPVVKALDPQVVHGQGIFIGGIVAAAAPRSLPRLVTVRGNARQDTLAEYPRRTRALRAVWGDLLVRQILDAVDVTVNVHPDWRINLPREPRSLVHIPNIVDNVFFATTRAPIPGRVLFCGGTRKIKGFDLLEAAWPDVRRSIPSVSLRVVGWPKNGRHPELDGMDISGALDSNELAAELGLADVVVIPSRYEVSPILLAEAWAVGTPVIATDAGGMSTLAPGAAIVIPSNSCKALASAVIGVLDGSVDMSEFTRSGRARAERHREGPIVAAHLDVYKAVLRSRPAVLMREASRRSTSS